MRGKCPNTELFVEHYKLSTILRIHLHDGKSKLWIFYQEHPKPSERTSRYLPKEHPDTFRKNIRIPSEITYLLQLMKKVKMVIARMRWIAIHFNNNDSTDNWNQRWYKLYFLIRPQFCSGLVSIFNRCFYMLFCLLPMFYRIFYIFPLSFHIILWNLSV